MHSVPASCAFPQRPVPAPAIEEQVPNPHSQVILKFPPRKDGITFPEIPDQTNTAPFLKLNATSDADVPVSLLKSPAAPSPLP